MATAQPQRFGPYVILDRIGDGGMAEIFLAKMQGYSGFEKLIALKKIHPKYSRNHTFAQMLIHEAKLAAALTHFNVVQVHDLGEIDEQVYIAMEYVRGRDLAAVLSNTYKRNERLPLELALFIATEFLTGLEYAHRMRSSEGTPLGIIHRDISPQNILISYEGEVKVTDFGIARIISEKNEFQLPGNLHGKFGYMSPEQAHNREIDQRSDVFSAGVVLWEMLVGTRLFRGRDQQETIDMVASKVVDPPSAHNPEVPLGVDHICLKALARDRMQRYQTMGALLGELSRAADSLSRRAGSRDLSVYMRRQFGTSGGGFRAGRPGSPGERSSVRPQSGFHARDRGPDVALAPSGERVALGQILLQKGAIDVGDLELALAEQRAQGGRIGEVLVGSAALADDELAQALATQSNLPVISTADLTALPPPRELIARFPRHAAEANSILPLAVAGTHRKVVRLAVADPYDERAILEAKVLLATDEVALLVAPRSAIRLTLQSWYGPNVSGADSEMESVESLLEALDGLVMIDPATPAAEPSPRILVADADDELAETLAARLRLEGWDVEVVSDGRSARASCRARAPTVAFLDAALPKIDGYNLLLELRATEADTAVFITSERVDEFRQAKALELGADDFLSKPLPLEVIASKVRREIQKRASQRRWLVPRLRAPGVSGSLEDMTVVDIAQSLELGRKTAHVIVQYEDGRQGVLRVDDGRLVGAVTQSLAGPEAFYALAEPGPGLFRIEHRPSAMSPNIEASNTALLLEAVRRLDEAEARVEPEPALDPEDARTQRFDRGLVEGNGAGPLGPGVHEGPKGPASWSAEDRHAHGRMARDHHREWELGQALGAKKSRPSSAQPGRHPTTPYPFASGASAFLDLEPSSDEGRAHEAATADALRTRDHAPLDSPHQTSLLASDLTLENIDVAARALRGGAPHPPSESLEEWVRHQVEDDPTAGPVRPSASPSARSRGRPNRTEIARIALRRTDSSE